VVHTWNIPDINLQGLGKNMSGILVFYTYTGYRKWVDKFQVYVGIFQKYRLSGHLYGIFQEYVRPSNFYGFQMVSQAAGASEEMAVPQGMPRF
jgi:hypothetical protein